LEASKKDEQRIIAGRTQTVGAGMHLEREHLRVLAEEGFDLAAVHFPHVNASGCVRVLTNFIPFRCRLASKCKPKCTRRTWRSGIRENVWHSTKRCFQRQQKILNLEHYLEALTKKARSLCWFDSPGAVAGTRALAD